MKSERVTQTLIDRNMTISFMESCTGGLLASMFTDTQGASAVFFGSFVTYANETKIACGVEAKVIEEHGVYSIECAKEMARAVKEHFKTDIAIGITGNTGNVDPKNPEGLLGEAFYCIMIGKKAYPFQIQVPVEGMTRKQIKQYYADAVYASLEKLLSK